MTQKNVIAILPFNTLHPFSALKKGQYILDWEDYKKEIRTWVYDEIPNYLGWTETFRFVLYNDKQEIVAQRHGFRLVIARKAFEEKDLTKV